MAVFKITNEDGLITTTVHGMEQDVFMVTEDRVSAFNNYSFEFQLWITFFSIDVGFFLGNMGAPKSVNFLVSLILGVIIFLFLFLNYRKFKKVRDSLFTRAKAETSNAREVSPQ
jgi:hypothetical protein